VFKGDMRAFEPMKVGSTHVIVNANNPKRVAMQNRSEKSANRECKWLNKHTDTGPYIVMEVDEWKSRYTG
jgi:hypothetical protein